MKANAHFVQLARETFQNRGQVFETFIVVAGKSFSRDCGKLDRFEVIILVDKSDGTFVWANNNFLVIEGEIHLFKVDINRLDA